MPTNYIDKIITTDNTEYVISVDLPNIQNADDLKAIEALSGSSGLLKKTAENTWTLDSTQYPTSINGANGDVILSNDSATTGITISDHSTSSIYGVGSSTTSVYGVKSGTNSTTTASKASGSNGTVPTLGTAFSVPNVTAAGSGSFTQGSFSGGSFTPSVDTSTHTLSFSFTPATHGADSHTHKPPTLGTKFTIPNITSVGTASSWSFTNVTVPIRADSATTVPIKNSTATTVVTGKSHTVNDSGHTHTINAQ